MNDSSWNDLIYFSIAHPLTVAFASLRHGTFANIELLVVEGLGQISKHIIQPLSQVVGVTKEKVHIGQIDGPVEDDLTESRAMLSVAVDVLAVGMIRSSWCVSMNTSMASCSRLGAL
jgi:hypothetical protein